MKIVSIEDLKIVKERANIPTLLKSINAEKICEVGVAEGYNFNRLLTAQCVKLAVGVDIWQKVQNKGQNDYPFSEDEVNSFYQNMLDLSKRDSRVQVIKDYSVNASKKFEDNYFDFVYIDADHTEDAVYADLCAWYPKVRPGGVLAGHDYFENELPNGVKFGVIEALNRFREENNLPIHVDGEGWYDWFIPKPAKISISNKFPVILTMTVKNEEHIIHRCLDSVLSYVDGVAIAVDSRTTDNTLSRSIELAQKYNKPYKIEVKECKFIPQFDRVDISDARNQSIELAEQLIEDFFPSKKCYHLFVDADEALIFNSNDPFAPLDGAHNFEFIKNYPSGLRSYSGMQLFLAFNGYYWEDEIHEQVSQRPGYVKVGSLKIDTFYLDFRHLGARSKDPQKINKDISLMKWVLEKRPNYRKMQYYLALAYKEAGLIKEEIETYKQITNNPTAWKEEKWYSYIQLGQISDKENLIYYMLKAYELDKSRAEPLYHLITFCIKEGLNKMANNFAKMAIKLNKPPKGSFYLSEDMYDWKIKSECAIAAFYDGDIKESYIISNKLLEENLLPAHEIEREKNNRRFSIRRYFDKPTIAFYIYNDIDWTIQKANGFGVSESCLLQLAKFFTQNGYYVIIYCKTQEEGVFDDIGYIRNYGFDIDCDILISFGNPKCFDRVKIKCNKAYLWLHDIYIRPYITQNDVNRFKKICISSNAHKNSILEYHPFISDDKFYETRNDIYDWITLFNLK